MSAIFAVSNYAIRYARFAWNPNSTPFWTLLALYAIAEVISEKQKRKYLWSVVAGIAIGIGVQLHTTLLLFLPMTTIVVFGYLAFKNKKVLGYFFAILAVSLFLNTPQIVNEYQHNGENIKAFFGGVKTKQGAESTLTNNLLHGTSCWVQGNIDIISGYEISDKCSFAPGARTGETVVFLLGFVFVLGGTILGFRYLSAELDADKKSFLAVVSVFTGIAFLIFIKLAFELSVRFYLVLIFLPFLLLGFWIQFLREKFHAQYGLILAVSALVFISSNLYFVHKAFAELADYSQKGGTVDVITLKQAEEFSDFISANYAGAPEIYITGNGKFLFKAYKSIKYLVEKNNTKLLLANTKTALPRQYFYVARSAKKIKLQQDPTATVLQLKTYGKFTIMLVQRSAIVQP